MGIRRRGVLPLEIGLGRIQGARRSKRRRCSVRGINKEIDARLGALSDKFVSFLYVNESVVRHIFFVFPMRESELVVTLSVEVHVDELSVKYCRRESV